jgi:hypothetical protein
MILVEWADRALDQLADDWVVATPAERDEITRKVERINRRLESDPLDVGESRSRHLRLEVSPPIAVWFTVSADASYVRVVRFQRLRRKKQ